MQISNLVRIQNIIKTKFNESLEIFEAEIITITDKAIQIEWDDSSWLYHRVRRTFIPKSLINIISSKIVERQKQKLTKYLISIPDWIKLNVRIIKEMEYPIVVENDGSRDDENNDVFPCGFSSIEEEILAEYYEQIERDEYVQELEDIIDDYKENIEPWSELWDKSIICKRCYRKIKVECTRFECPMHPDNKKTEDFNTNMI